MYVCIVKKEGSSGTMDSLLESARDGPTLDFGARGCHAEHKRCDSKGNL